MSRSIRSRRFSARSRAISIRSSSVSVVSSVLRFETLLPGSEQIGMDSQVPGRFRNRKLLIEDQLRGLSFELLAAYDDWGSPC